MKKFILSIGCFFAGILFIQAQVLYGTTINGGKNGNGAIIKLMPTSNDLTVPKSFGGTTSETNPAGSLIQAADGKLYGMALNGGNHGVGVIFSFDPSASIYTKLKDFDNINGANPFGSLLWANDRKLYGMTVLGGSNNVGVIFSYDPFSNTYTKLVDFDGTNGASPLGNLIQASNGKLFGMTQKGGSNSAGVIFSFDPSASTYTKLKDFNFTNGANPRGSLMKAGNGKLYGMTEAGGSHSVGVIFSFDPSASTYTKLKDFDFTNGGNPGGNLMQANNGKLYGCAGTIFSFDPSTSTYTKLNTNGSNGSLMQASDGKLYGMSVTGGINNRGTIFSFDPSSSIYNKLKDFDYTNGAEPFSTFIEVYECITATTYYQDADEDGYGNPNISLKACNKPAGYVTNSGDCDDTNKAGHAPVKYFRDLDGDSYGDGFVFVHVCSPTPPAGYVKNDYDCDDHKKSAMACNERVRMCHNGVLECVYAKDINKKLCLGWTLGLCPSNCIAPLSSIITGDPNNALQPIPAEYKLSSYPNPFKSTSTIQYELPVNSNVSIKVYDLSGRTMATLVDENKKAGTYTVIFNAGNLSKGSFYYRIIAVSKEGRFEQTNTMIQIR